MNKDYSWIKIGAKVRIKTKEQIYQRYGEYMPCSLTEPMKQFCGDMHIYIIKNVLDECDNRCLYHIQLNNDYWWPEDALLPAITKLGNIL